MFSEFLGSNLEATSKEALEILNIDVNDDHNLK